MQQKIRNKLNIYAFVDNKKNCDIVGNYISSCIISSYIFLYDQYQSRNNIEENSKDNQRKTRNIQKKRKDTEHKIRIQAKEHFERTLK